MCLRMVLHVALLTFDTSPAVGTWHCRNDWQRLPRRDWGSEGEVKGKTVCLALGQLRRVGQMDISY